MVFKMASLQESNSENVNDFLNRALKIVNNENQYDSRKTFKSGICLLIAPVPVHCFSITFDAPLCISFHEYLQEVHRKKIYKNKKSPFFMIRFLMSCKCLTDAKEMLLGIFVLLNSGALNDVNCEHYVRLKR